MDIDLSKLAVLILAVLPGYFALRALKSYSPLSRQQKGATEELAEFFAYSTLVHIVLLPFGLLLWFRWAQAWMFPSQAVPLAQALSDPSIAVAAPAIWVATTAQLKTLAEGIPALAIGAYLIISLVLGWAFGLVRALLDSWRISGTIRRQIAALNVRSQQAAANGKVLGARLLIPVLAFSRSWSRWVTRYHISQRPMIYDAMFAELDERLQPKVVFVEVILKDGQGAYLGQVAGFSSLRDEEKEKLLYIEEVWFREAGPMKSLQKLDNQIRVLLDLAEASSIRVRQVIDK